MTWCDVWCQLLEKPGRDWIEFAYDLAGVSFISLTISGTVASLKHLSSDEY